MTKSDPGQRAAVGDIALATLFYILMFVVLTHPLASQFPTRITTDGPNPLYAGDGAMFIWNVDHFATSVRAGANPFVAHDIIVPAGAELWMHSYSPIVGVLGLFTRSPIVALALATAASFVLSGIGGFLFARRFLQNRALAALAGAIFAFCPFKLARLLGHFNLELTATIPFFAILLFEWHAANPPATTGVAPNPGLRTWFAAAALLALTLLSDFYYTYFCLWMVLSTLLLRRLELHPIRASRRRIFVVTALVIGASTAIVEIYMLLGRNAHGAFSYSADLVGYLLPSSHHRWVGGERLVALKARLRNGTIEHEVFAGLTVVALVAWLLRARALRTLDARERWLAWFGATFLLLASPVVRIGGIRVLGLPHALINMLPFIGNLRVPARFSVVMMLAAGVLAMMAIERLVLPRLGRVARAAVVTGVCGALLFEYGRKPFDTLAETDIPPIYARLADLPAGTLLELPFGLRDGLRSLGAERTSAMFFATKHRKPIVGGMLARLPAATFERYERDPVLGPLLAALADKPTALEPNWIAREKLDLFVTELDLRYVVIRPDARGSSTAIALEGMLTDRVAEKYVDGDWTLLVLRR
jgi:hypothetical protein